MYRTSGLEGRQGIARGERSEPLGKGVKIKSPERGERIGSLMFSIEWFSLAPFQGFLICYI